MDFQFFMPTQVIMSENGIINNAPLFKEFGKKALIVTGSASAKLCGAMPDITQALQEQGILYDLYDRIKSNPTVASVYEGAAYAREAGAQFLIAIGGGSVMDAAKAIALLTMQEIEEEELFSGVYGPEVLPVIAVPTTAGTGAEVTPYSVLTNDKRQTKTSIASPYLFPRIAFLDARYTKSLPMTITINTALDALSHAIEGMLTVRATAISNSIAAESIARISQCLRGLSPGKALDEAGRLPTDLREKLLLGSMLAGVVITHTGTTVVHPMGYSLTYFKNVDHGRANALLLPSYLRFVAKHEPEAVKKILSAMGLNSMDELEAVFLRLLGEREVITAKELERYAAIAVQSRNAANSRVVPTREDIENIYARSLQIL
jgi:alcohol dehydrogenase class IV